MTECRLQCLERKLDREPVLQDSFHRQIQEYQEKGYAHQATTEEFERAERKRTWYLPLGVVTNPNKPEKVRVIWDASVKAGGVSLNNMLLKGPDQLTALPTVLFRFRQFGVAVNAHIQEMFHQVRIREEDKFVQCFLYRKNKTQPIDVFSNGRCNIRCNLFACISTVCQKSERYGTRRTVPASSRRNSSLSL